MDKPAGPTSHDVVAAVRRATGVRRVGHAGTLDPFATGLLTVLVGRATRLAPYLTGLPKEYTGVLRLGIRTDTDDSQGNPVARSEAWRDLPDSELDAAMRGLTGEQLQEPPRFSAKKVAGVPAHRRVRRGETVELAPHRVVVERFARTGPRTGPDVPFAARVGSGTYVRALARDLGARLGCGAHLIALRRTAVGPFRVDDAVPMAALSVHTPLRPPADAVPHLPGIPLDAGAREAVRHGRRVPAAGDDEGPAALLADGTLVAVAERDGPAWHPRVVLEDA